MRANDLRGISKVKTPRTTIPADSPTPIDRVNRQFAAETPDRLWVADITYIYIRTFAGWVYTAFILDMYTRMIVNWQISGCSAYNRFTLSRNQRIGPVQPTYSATTVAGMSGVSA